MEFHPAPDDVENGHFFVQASENEEVFVSVLPVMFGYRVVAYSKGSVGPSLNWCAGGSQEDVERLYSLMLAILKKREEAGENEVYRGIPPVSVLKPFYRDLDFVTAVSELAGDDLEMISLPPVVQAREFYLLSAVSSIAVA